MALESTSMIPADARFRCVIPVRWGDLDAQNHVNNTLYFRFLEEARVQLFNAAGLPIPTKKVVLLVHETCDFIKPIEYPATVSVILGVKKIGTSSLTFQSRIECHSDANVIYSKGCNVVVGACASTGKPQPWSTAELEALASCFK